VWSHSCTGSAGCLGRVHWFPVVHVFHREGKGHRLEQGPQVQGGVMKTRIIQVFIGIALGVAFAAPLIIAVARSPV
jgi:hypothetical protein